MTFRVGLILEGDATGAKKALDETHRGLGKIAGEGKAAAAATNAAATSGAGAARAMTGGFGGAATAIALSTQQTQQLGLQVNDLAQQLATGTSPFTAMVQQGSQIVQIFGPGTGVVAALRSVGTAMYSFLLNPLTLATIGLAVASQAAVTFFSSTRDGGKTTEAVLTRHNELVKSIRKSYGEAAAGAREYSQDSQAVLKFQLDRSLETIREKIKEQTSGLLFGKGLFDGGLFGGANEFGERQLNPGYEHLAGAIGKLQKSAESGVPDIKEFRDTLARLAADRPELAALVEEIIKSSDALDQLVGSVQASNRATQRGAETSSLAALGGFENATTASLDRLRQAHALDLVAITAKSPAEKAALAAQRERLALTGQEITAAERALKVSQAAGLAGAQAQHAIGEGTRERHRALEQVTASAQLEIDLIGVATGEAARMRLEFEEIAQLKAEAARNGVAADEREIAYIRQKATEYGRLAGLQETLEQLNQVGHQVADSLVGAFSRFAETGKLKVRDMAASILQDLAKIGQAAVSKGLGDFLGSALANAGSSLFGGGPTNIVPSARGNAFVGGRLVTAFANGGVPGLIDRPTVFPMRSGGVGIAGEMDNEAIFPLTRGADGKLGIRGAGGGGSLSVNFAPVISSAMGPGDRAWVMGKLQEMKRDIISTVDARRGAQLRSRSDTYTRAG